ncbi:DUF2076 domain-containing protein [Amaricoccus solimangrovi]|uniref:DUF2076 domain-containing protein n=1 Tax=Amaricoccus solimangrovi TaxID=2589815 RepID=A0A501WH70_9RHOB|nr:DUF2076 domain-containing protein [Amaricoccus solimangrovi]TPE47700.1 DUF2076 domain-containing protein [Amaricoccus solimangrovi]
MDRNDQQAIEGLFSRLAEAERAAPARDAAAEGFIARAIAAQPGAPYYMAQTIVVQQAALEQAQARIEALETEQARAGGGGFLSSLFGGGARPTPRPAPGNGPATQAMRAPHQGGGFLAGAAQTAVGVAGGVLLGNAIAGMFSGDPAMAEETPPEEDAPAEEMSFDEDFEM